ncbi:DsbA family protein [Streptantibioticus rubrisoli]|uniref:DsbA family protein n=1 Tax=Streptantibioticus rubrisoli TaxID=1387313 RepID=A0ABT1P7Y0_9ACTN|nr:DsbA family protein [Streptantibioticus rubrisoli]MCQ4041482.1 DsbA family protein [Streptantibioticus rubrisoli]
MSVEPSTAEPVAVETDPRLPLTPDTIAVFTDLNCSFAHVAVHRLHETRRRLGLDGVLWFDFRAFPLELFNREVNARPGVDSEISVLGSLEPDAGWRLWQGPDWTYPVTTLPALEAVHAAKSQSWRASEQLDRALRRAFWAEGRCISMRHVILEVAEATGAVDVPQLADALDTGSARPAVMAQYRAACDGRVNCSPHIFLKDGTDSANPGISAHWINGGFGTGYPVIDTDRPDVYEELLTHAAGLL